MEQDLTTLLTIEQRADLTLLVANITEVMHKQIEEVFEASHEHHSGTQNPPRLLETSDKNPNLTDENERQEETEEEKKARRLREKREKELSAPKLLELKRDVLDSFEKWQMSIISRVGEVVNSKETAEKQHKEEATVKATPDAAPVAAHKAINTNTNTQDSDAALIDLYPPTPTFLYSLPREKRMLLLHAMLLLSLSLEHYSAHSRILLLHLSSSLHLPLHILTEDEVTVAQGLLSAAKHLSGASEAEKRTEEGKTGRYWKVGLAGVAGAAIIGVTGGLAAPLVAGAIGTVMGGLGLGATAAAGLLGTLAHSGVIVGALFGAYGGRMSGKMMDSYAKQVSDFAFLPLRGDKRDLHNQHAKETPVSDRRLRVTIGISGWLTQREDIITPWRVLGHNSEVFALRWELEALMNLGNSLESVIKSAAWGIAKKEIIARTFFASLFDALWPIALLKVSKIVDNPFSVAKSRADKAGLVLADALINRAQGERPVTLMGYSLGSRMVYSCLMSLAERRAFGLVERAVLIGTPAPSDSSVWRAMRSVVAGRLVNVYSENDYILGFLYRTSSIQFGVAGIQEIKDVKGVENIDVSEMVSGHLRYQYLVGSILEKIGWEDIDRGEVAKEEETLALIDQKDRAGDVEGSGNDADDDEVRKMEKQVETKNEKQGFMGRAAKTLHLG